MLIKFESVLIVIRGAVGPDTVVAVCLLVTVGIPLPNKKRVESGLFSLEYYIKL